MFKYDYVLKDFTQDESQYFAGPAPKVDIPLSDEAAWKMYPHFRWMHNKMSICDAQNVINYPDGISPHEFPIFLKPIINLGGMSAGAQVVHTETDYNTFSKPGFFLMSILNDPQYSIDVALARGVIRWHATMLEHKNEKGSFALFEKVPTPNDVWEVAECWIHAHFAGHTGIINLEIMDGVIIESHQRLSPQFVDLYGEGWLEAVIALYETRTWLFGESPEHAYSLPVRVHTKPTSLYRYEFSPESIEKARVLCNSVQIWTEDIIELKLYNDEHSVRLAVLNGFDLDDMKIAERLLLENLRS